MTLRPFLPDVILQLAGHEGEDEGHESQQDVIGEDAADEDHRALITLQDDLDVLGRRVLDGVRRQDDEPHRARHGLHTRAKGESRKEGRSQANFSTDVLTCISVATAAIALWWTKERESASGTAQALMSLLLCVLVTMTSGLPLLAAASAAALAALAAALLRTRAAFRA